MNIDIPQPTTLEMLEKDLVEARDVIRVLDKNHVDERFIWKQRGLIEGIEWAIQIIKLNQ